MLDRRYPECSREGLTPGNQRSHRPDRPVRSIWPEDASTGQDGQVEAGIGHEAAKGSDQVIGEIPIDAIFSPVQRVRFSTEDTRVGQQTNYQKLILDVWTNGTITPDMALVEASKILRKHLNPFVQFDELGDSLVSDEVADANAQDDEIIRKLRMPVSELDLSVRASNCLETAKIRSVGELVQRSEDDLLAVRSFGRTSLKEVKEELEKLGLHLGYPVPEGLLNG